MFVEAVQVDEKWVPPTFAHTSEEVRRLQEYVSQTILLSHLNTQLRDTVIDALERKEFPKGYEIIQQVKCIVIILYRYILLNFKAGGFWRLLLYFGLGPR